MFAQVLHRWGGTLSYEEVPVPVPAPGEALVRVEACGVGLTVLNYMRGDLRQPGPGLPRIPGHEIVGRVEALGDGTTGLDPGDRVMAYFYLTCGHCDFCRLAHEPLCRNFGGYVGVNRDGGYAEYVSLPMANWLPVPKEIPAVEATAIPDAIATPYHVCRRAGIGTGDLVMVVGAGGGVGIHMVQMVRAFGGEAVGVDLGEAKLQAIRAAGAMAAVDFRAGDRLDRIRAVAPAGVTAAIDFVGSPETLAFCLEALGRRGRLVLLTTFPGVEFPVSPRQMVFDELTVLGSRYTSRWELMQAARLVARGAIRPVVSEVVPLAAVETLHNKLHEGTLIGRGAVRCQPPL